MRRPLDHRGGHAETKVPQQVVVPGKRRVEGVVVVVHGRARGQYLCEDPVAYAGPLADVRECLGAPVRRGRKQTPIFWGKLGDWFTSPK